MIDSKFTYRARVFDRAEPCELSDDYTLPDYMPAVGRVLSCTACVAPPALYIASGSIEYAGGMRYRLMYESADDSSLWCAELPTEYDIFVTPDRDSSLPSDPAKLSELADVRAENVTARITAPRRMTVKSRVRLTTDLSAEKAFEPNLRGDLSDPDAVKTLTAKAPSGLSVSATSAPVSCRDKITHAELGLSDSDAIRIISSRSDVMIKSLEPIADSLECRGDLCVSLMFIKEGEGERPRRVSRKIPFSGTVELGAQNIGTRAYGSCPNLTAHADDDGITLEGDILLCAESEGATEVTYLRDIYSQAADCETSRTKLNIRHPVSCFNANATLSASSDTASLGFDSGMKLADFSARIVDHESSISNGKLNLNGKMKISALADNGAELIPAEFDSDFKYAADIPEAAGSEELISNIIPSLCDIRCRIDGDRIFADCELCVAVKVEKESTMNVISEINFSPFASETPRASQILICYPASGETLWDVAKRYRSDAKTIAEKNSFETASPDAEITAKYLII